MLQSALNEPQPAKEPDPQGHPKQPTMPPTSHTLTDLLITLSSYLPPDTYPALFSLASSILPLSNDPQLQKKAYKLLPRLTTSPHGALALRAHNLQLQALLLSTASTVTAPTRRDRLAAVAVVVEHLPPTDLSFIPAILSEVVLAAKEVNEKARTQAFDLLVLMARRMHEEGGTVIQARIPNMPSSAPAVPATLSEFLTMVSAGLAGTSPHTVSASITALTRVLYAFASALDRAVIIDLVQTMELFLASANREIVRSTLGFVKVAVVSLPEDVVRPRLEQLVPALTAWSHEHKARFRAKVKHIFERMMRRFGAETVEKYVPEDDRKFVQNIRKTKERSKRQKAAAAAQKEGGSGGGDDDADDGREESARQRKKRTGEFDSAYDDALASDSDDADSDALSADEEELDGRRTGKAAAAGGRKRGRGEQQGGTYITESLDEPLDLLSRSSLAHISSRKPAARSTLPGSASAAKPRKHKMNLDGKLIIGGGDGDEDDDDAMRIDGSADDAGLGGNGEEMSLEQGVNAYVEAIRGRDAVQRGRGGRLKFSNKREKGVGEGKIEVDDDGDGGVKKGKKSVRFAGAVAAGGSGEGGERAGNRGKRVDGGRGNGGGGFRGRGRGGIGKRVERRPLGGGRIGSGGVAKVGGRRGRR